MFALRRRLVLPRPAALLQRNIRQRNLRPLAREKGSQASIEQQYERKTPIEHVLLRPGMYVGPKEPACVNAWVYDYASRRMVREKVEYVPALFKIFDEILVNAADNKQRDSKTSFIRVDIDPGGPDRPPRISVCNDGRGIPIQMHRVEGMYVPELVFGHLLTGSNFDDSEGRLTGGRHGYGAKLANIFSSRFEVETVDAAAGLRYVQTWRNNMRDRGEPLVTPLAAAPAVDIADSADNAAGTGSKPAAAATPEDEAAAGDVFPTPAIEGNRTRITFEPDMTCLGVESGRIGTDDLRMMHRRVVDVAGCVAPVDVFLNGERVAVSSFSDYVGLFLSGGGGSAVSNGAADELPSGERESGDFAVAVTAASGITDSKPFLSARVNSRWEVGVAASDGAQFEQVSFVNSMATPRGGTHVNLVALQLSKRLAEHIARRHPELEVTPASVRPHLFLFVKALVENPSFDSQMKEMLTTRPADFGSTCFLGERFVRAVAAQSGVVERVMAHERERQRRRLRRTGADGGGAGAAAGRRQLLDVPKLEDAHRAGTADAHRCTLILTEGDSAKALAVAGLEVVGREIFGVFPLRGKFLNVRDAGLRQVAENAEVGHLCTILGLDFDKRYEDGPDRAMRYGRVMIMTDQDHDGSHIKGLLLNFFHHFWPGLLASDGFMQQFVTPILKVAPRGSGSGSVNGGGSGGGAVGDSPGTSSSAAKRKGRRKKGDAAATAVDAASEADNAAAAEGGGGGSRKGDVLPFFSVPEFEAWRRRQGMSAAEFVRRWRVKYYKGLGTSTSAEGRQYFGDLARHVKTFDGTSAADGEAIDMVFNRARAGERRDWLLERYRPGAFLPTAATRVTVADFINTELVHFSHADNVRSIPSAVDGLKPSQRKVLYACFKRKLRSEIKVAQLAGYCSEHTAYHHGEQSLNATIVNMAQDFVGANNVPLLHPSGQFGTRLQGGKDSASARYIFTHLSAAARLLFPEADDELLARRNDDGALIEPFVYVPVVPLLLINGSQGIGTGWSTGVPAHNPLDVVDNTERMLAGLAPLPMLPWVRGFRGCIRPLGSGDGDDASGDADAIGGENGLDGAEDADGAATLGTAALNGGEGALSGGFGSDGGNGDGGDDCSNGGDIRSGRASSASAAVFVSEGQLEHAGHRRVTVTELPVGRWTSDYKDVLLKLVHKGVLRSFKEAHTPVRVRFHLEFESAGLGAQAAALPDAQLKRLLRLEATHRTGNMHAFDADGCIRRFGTAVDVLRHGFGLRLELYTRRRQRLEAVRAFAARHAANRERFVEAVRSGRLRITGGDRTKRELEEMLREDGFDTLTAMAAARQAALPKPFGAESDATGAMPLVTFSTEAAAMAETDSKAADSDIALDLQRHSSDDGSSIGSDKAIGENHCGGGGSSGGGGDGGGETVGGGDDDRAMAGVRGEFDYLLDMTLSSFTSERLAQLRRDVEAAERGLAEMRAKRPEDLWREDLQALRRELLRDPEYSMNRNPIFVALSLSSTTAAAMGP